jgi:signal transduction histidine kinase/CheY-like chemotaxis protein/HPt (histidine-containing phosphotransfer) domain-containing protein
MSGHRNQPSEPSRSAWFSALAARLLPEEFGNEPDRLRRAKIAVLLPLPFVVYGACMGALHLAFGNRTQAALIFVAILLGILSMGLLRLTKSLHLTAHIQLALLASALVFLAWRTGTSTSSTLFLVLLVPLIGGMVLGWRAAVGWAVAVLASYGLLYWLLVAGLSPKPIWSSDRLPLVNVIAAVFALSIVVMVVALFEWMRGRALDELKEAQEQALAASRAKSDFLANMSHEVRTPLHGLLGSLQLMQRTQLTTAQRGHLDTMASSGQTLLGVVDDILDYSKVEAGRMELAIAEFSLGALLDDVANAFGPTAARCGLELVLDAPTDLPSKLRGDPRRLRQILANLISNAIKFTPAGEIVVRVTHESDDRRAAIAFTVVDEGPGLAPEVLIRVLEPFEQGDHSTSRMGSGTGLGLAIVCSFLELMDSELRAESVVGKGSEFGFSIELPVAQPAAAAVERPLRGVEVMACVPSTGRAAVVRRRLEAAGAKLTLVESVAALSRLVQDEDRVRPDAALIDVPVDGDAAALIAALGQIARLSVIALCVDGAALALSPDEVEVVTKPVRSGKLLQAIADAADISTTSRFSINQDLGEIGQSDGKPATILVVEDNPVNQRVTGAHLELLNYPYLVAADGEEAVEAWLENHEELGLVLMDCHMPKVDGFEATRRIRKLQKDEDLPHTPIVALTADVMPETPELVRDAGMDDYLSKPFDADQLAAIVRRWVAPLVQRRSALPERPSSPRCSAAIADVLDEASVEAIRALGTETMCSIFDLYANELPGELASMRAEHEAGDSKALRARAHKLKSSSRMVGALSLGDRLEAIELTEGDIAAGEIAALEREMARVRQAVAQQVAQDMAAMAG